MKPREYLITSMQKDLPQDVLYKKLSKFNDKGRILKSAREEKMVTYKETPIRLSADFSIVKERVE